jgi:hypothetical protein
MIQIVIQLEDRYFVAALLAPDSTSNRFADLACQSSLDHLLMYCRRLLCDPKSRCPDCRRDGSKRRLEHGGLPHRHRGHLERSMRTLSLSRRSDSGKEPLTQDLRFFVDSLQDKVLVGLRPGRTSLRLESSVIGRSPRSPSLSRDDDVLLVHCYGLGGSGFTIGPGLAEDIVTNHVSPFLSRET